MTTSGITAPATDQERAVRGVFSSTSQAWADGDAEAFAAYYTPDATVILPGVYLPGREAIRDTMAAAFGGPLKDTRRRHEVQRLRFTGPSTAIVITESVTGPAAASAAGAQPLERATWVLTRHDSGWLIEAYHSSPAQ